MRYVAIGSSIAAGPGLQPRAPHSTFRAGRSARNYPSLLAAQLGYQLLDVSSSGATIAHVLTEKQHGAAPQVDVLDGTEDLVTVSVGGNDIGYVPMLVAAGMARPVRWTMRHYLDRSRWQQAERDLPGRLRALAAGIRARAPRARILLVEYPTLLPPTGPAGNLDAAVVDHGRELAALLADATRSAAVAEGCETVPVGRASRDHHAWAPAPWVSGPGYLVPGKTVPFHPNELGMRAVANLIADHLA